MAYEDSSKLKGGEKVYGRKIETLSLIAHLIFSSFFTQYLSNSWVLGAITNCGDFLRKKE